MRAGFVGGINGDRWLRQFSGGSRYPLSHGVSWAGNALRFTNRALVRYSKKEAAKMKFENTRWGFPSVSVRL